MNVPKNLFIKWFIIFSTILAGSIIAGHFGLIALVLSSDISHLTSIIGGLFLISSLFTGKLAYDLAQDDTSGLLTTREGKVKLKKKLKFLNFMADSFFTLGLMGTIIGFCYMMKGTLNSSADVSTIIQQLKIGSSTKLYTTLAGIVSSLLLQLQILIVESDLIEEDDQRRK